MYKKKQKQQDLYLITTYSLAPNFEIFMRNGNVGGSRSLASLEPQKDFFEIQVNSAKSCFAKPFVV